jgi:hypothetical protein
MRRGGVMRPASIENVGGEWEIELPSYGRRWLIFAIVAASATAGGFALCDGSFNVPIVGLTFFLAAVSGVSGLWSP